MPRHINNAGLNIIKAFETLQLTVYHGEGDPPDVYTQGFGHTAGITAGSPPIDEDTANEWLQNDVHDAESYVSKYIRTTLTDNQFSALVSLVFNCGTAPLIHTLGAYLNTATYDKAADEFLKWNHSCGVVSNGLTRRRIAERELFLKPTT